MQSKKLEMLRSLLAGRGGWSLRRASQQGPYQIRMFCSVDGDADSHKKEDDEDKEGAGRDLAKLAKISRALRSAIEKTARENQSPPEILVPLEQDVDEATQLIKTALEKAGSPCTIEELADRINDNVLKVPVHALNYKDLLRANALRDSIEGTLISLQVVPPLDAVLDGHGRLWSKVDRKAQRRKAQLESGQATGQEAQRDAPSESEIEAAPTELRPPSEADLAKRKAHMEKAASMDQVLRGYDTALLQVGRVHKVVKGGTTMSMRALVVIGNRKGTAGYGEGKSDTAQHAIERACRDAKRNLLHIDLHQGRTIFHRVKGSYVKSRVTMWPAPKGTGISASNNFFAVLQLFGLKDVGAKLHGPRCLSNAVKALFNTLSNVQSPQSVAAARGLKEIVKPRLLEIPKGAKRPRLRAL